MKRTFLNLATAGLLFGLFFGCIEIPGASDAKEASDVGKLITSELPDKPTNDPQLGIYVRSRSRFTEVLVRNLTLDENKISRLHTILHDFCKQGKKPIRVRFYRGTSESIFYKEFWVSQ
jgi:hypothetical protein